MEPVALPPPVVQHRHLVLAHDRLPQEGRAMRQARAASARACRGCSLLRPGGSLDSVVWFADMARPEIFVIGGPNGAGKSTIASVILPEGFQVERFVNADLIAQSLAPASPEPRAFAAGRMMLQRVRDFYAQRERFGFESTLASRTFAPFLQDAQGAGYLIHIAYLWLSSVELALDRIRVRVLRGGHDVPEGTVRRRYYRSLANFFDLYEPLANTWLLCDNSRF